MKKLILGTSFSDPKIPEIMTWTHSSQKTFNNCNRQFFWKYMMRLRQNYRDHNLMIGSYFHLFKETWYATKKDAKAIAEPLRKQMEKELDAMVDLFSQTEYDKADTAIACFTGMCMGFAEFYKDDRNKFEDILVEENFHLDYEDEEGEILFSYEGQIDMIYTQKNRLKFMEDKTAGMIGDTYIARLDMDNQIRGYYLGTQSIMGKAPKVCTYNVVKKSKLRKSKAKNESQEDFNERVAADYFTRPDFYFMRMPIKITNNDIEEFDLNLHLTDGKYQAIINGPEPENPYMWHANDAACTSYFKLCPFFKLCNGALDMSTEMFFTQGEELHSELRKDDDETPKKKKKKKKKKSKKKFRK